MMSIFMWFVLLAKGACSDKPVTNFSLHDVQYTSQLSRTFTKSVKFLSSFFRFPTGLFPRHFAEEGADLLTIILHLFEVPFNARRLAPLYQPLEAVSALDIHEH
jgi:hypothetical protein